MFYRSLICLCILSMFPLQLFSQGNTELSVPFSLPMEFRALHTTANDEGEVRYPMFDTIPIGRSVPKLVMKTDYDTLPGEGAETIVLHLTIYDPSTMSVLQTILDTCENTGATVDLEDINMDGYNDLRLAYGASGFSTLDLMHGFLLFHESDSTFIPAGFTLPHYQTSPSAKQIVTTSTLTGGRGQTEETYRVVNDQLELLRSESSVEDSYETKELIDGALVTTRQSTVNDSVDGSGNRICIITKKARMFDSLFTVQRIWKYPHEDVRDEQKRKTLLFEKASWGSGYYLFQKEEYQHRKSKNGTISTSVCRFKAERQAWKAKR